MDWTDLAVKMVTALAVPLTVVLGRASDAATDSVALGRSVD